MLTVRQIREYKNSATLEWFLKRLDDLDENVAGKRINDLDAFLILMPIIDAASIIWYSPRKKKGESLTQKRRFVGLLQKRYIIPEFRMISLPYLVWGYPFRASFHGNYKKNRRYAAEYSKLGRHINISMRKEEFSLLGKNYDVPLSEFSKLFGRAKRDLNKSELNLINLNFSYAGVLYQIRNYCVHNALLKNAWDIGVKSDYPYYTPWMDEDGNPMTPELGFPLPWLTEKLRTILKASFSE